MEEHKIHFCHLMFFYFCEEKTNIIQAAKKYALFIEMVPWLRVPFVSGLLSSEVQILIWKTENCSSRPAFFDVDQIKILIKDNSGNMTWNIAEMLYIPEMNEHCKAFKSSWIFDHNNVCALYNLTKKINGLYFPPRFSAQMQQKIHFFKRTLTDNEKWIVYNDVE